MRYFQALRDLHNVTFYRLCKQSTGNNSALARLSLRLVAAARLMLLFLHASLDWHAIAFRGHPGRDGREALWAWPRSPPPGPSPSHSWKTWDFAALARGGTWRLRAAAPGRPESCRPQPPRRTTTTAMRMRRPFMHRDICYSSAFVYKRRDQQR